LDVNVRVFEAGIGGIRISRRIMFAPKLDLEHTGLTLPGEVNRGEGVNHRDLGGTRVVVGAPGSRDPVRKVRGLFTD
jgi:hypothetical protein